MSTIRNAVLLYRPSLSIWTARKLDKDESAKVNKDNGAIDGAANVHKQLLPDSKELKAVQKWDNAFRTFIYTSTLPWDDCGWRAGAVGRHMEFMAEVGDRLLMGEALVDAFICAYAEAINRAESKLGRMFKRSEYPGVNEVKLKFKFTVDTMPIPNAEDFRVIEGGVPKAEVERLVQQAQAAVEQKVQAGVKEAYERLYEVVAAMANTLEQYGNKTVKKFNDSLVDNIAKLVEVMPALNLTNDAHLAALASDARQLAAYAAVDLRQNPTVRTAAIVEARTLATKFKGYVAASIPATLEPPPTVAATHIVIDEASAFKPVPPAKRALFADML
jgi:hypothetical protein